MNNSYAKHYNNILSWQSTFSKIPHINFYTSILFLIVGITGFIGVLLVFPEIPFVSTIFLIMGIGSGIWFVILFSKVRRMTRILEDLNEIKDFDIFCELIKSIIKTRKDNTLKDKTKIIDELYKKFSIKSKNLCIELSRIALDIQRSENISNDR
ncbi:MAG: hypothetical protein K8S87_05405 [Planctomycetes bacterium]|nr:hypothetical protein [Planctomycetota bacterium]